MMICVKRVSRSKVCRGLSRPRSRSRKVRRRSRKLITADMSVRMNISEVLSEELVSSTTPFMD